MLVQKAAAAGVVPHNSDDILLPTVAVVVGAERNAVEGTVGIGAVRDRRSGMLLKVAVEAVVDEMAYVVVA